jgi:hypothetical protein
MCHPSARPSSSPAFCSPAQHAPQQRQRGVSGPGDERAPDQNAQGAHNAAGVGVGEVQGAALMVSLEGWASSPTRHRSAADAAAMVGGGWWCAVCGSGGDLSVGGWVGGCRGKGARVLTDAVCLLLRPGRNLTSRALRSACFLSVCNRLLICVSVCLLALSVYVSCQAPEHAKARADAAFERHFASGQLGYN